MQVETDQSATTRIKTDRNGSWRIETRLDGARESLQGIGAISSGKALAEADKSGKARLKQESIETRGLTVDKYGNIGINVCLLEYSDTSFKLRSSYFLFP